MFFFRLDLLPVLIFGIVAICFARKITNYSLKSVSENSWIRIPIFREIFLVWTWRTIGTMAFVAYISTCLNNPPDTMRKEENRIVLLEQGVTTKGQVYKSWYAKLAPEGWTILYKFDIKDNPNGKTVTYWGDVDGPMDYYAPLSKGDSVTVIYLPENPKINCEIFHFLNHPCFRRTFKDAGKLQLLDKFRDEYEIKDYSLIQWYDLQRLK